MDLVSICLTPAAAVFLCEVVRYMNQAKILPPDGNKRALESSAWLEEIEAAVQQGLSAAAITTWRVREEPTDG